MAFPSGFLYFRAEFHKSARLNGFPEWYDGFSVRKNSSSGRNMLYPRRRSKKLTEGIILFLVVIILNCFVVNAFVFICFCSGISVNFSKVAELWKRLAGCCRLLSNPSRFDYFIC
jgi:hypothetical protein